MKDNHTLFSTSFSKPASWLTQSIGSVGGTWDRLKKMLTVRSPGDLN